MENIRFLNNIYLDEVLMQSDLKKLKQDLNDNPLSANVFVIAISTNEHDQLDVYHSKYLIQRFYKKNPPLVIGIAKKQGNAFALVEKIVQECVTRRGDVNLKAYLVGE
ncbi:MAG: hypothetical protein IJX63_14560 [Lachnospiraceae bacterium]|nr:hypothetical protein [Lachnospiraceae bacterium]